MGLTTLLYLKTPVWSVAEGSSILHLLRTESERPFLKTWVHNFSVVHNSRDCFMISLRYKNMNFKGQQEGQELLIFWNNYNYWFKTQQERTFMAGLQKPNSWGTDQLLICKTTGFPRTEVPWFPKSRFLPFPWMARRGCAEPQECNPLSHRHNLPPPCSLDSPDLSKLTVLQTKMKSILI